MCLKMHKTRFIFILQKCSIICLQGSDYCYPSTSLDLDLELGGGLGQRSHRVENCSSRFVPLLLEPGTAESRMGWWNSSRQRGEASYQCFLPLVCQQRSQNCDSRSRWSQGCLQCLQVETPDTTSITKLTVFCAKRVELSRPIPKYSISL